MTRQINELKVTNTSSLAGLISDTADEIRYWDTQGVKLEVCKTSNNLFADNRAFYLREVGAKD